MKTSLNFCSQFAKNVNKLMLKLNKIELSYYVIYLFSYFFIPFFNLLSMQKINIKSDACSMNTRYETEEACCSP